MAEKQYGRHARKPASASYAAREKNGETAKTRRIARALNRGETQPGWMLTQAGKPMRDPTFRSR